MQSELGRKQAVHSVRKLGPGLGAELTRQAVELHSFETGYVCVCVHV
jgi:hypothetical protein